MQAIYDIQAYIQNYIFPGTVYDFNVFRNQMETYGRDVNPEGYELYNKQVDYLCKKSENYDWKLEKKKKNKQKN